MTDQFKPGQPKNNGTPNRDSDSHQKNPQDRQNQGGTDKDRQDRGREDKGCQDQGREDKNRQDHDKKPDPTRAKE